MRKQATSTAQHRSVVLAICVQTPYHKGIEPNSYCQEFENLLKTNGVEVHQLERIKLRTIDPATFFTKGKLYDIQQICEKKSIEELIVSEPLTTRQERNLEDILHCTIYDRTRLILEIFEKAATSIEGRTQVAIALLKHNKSRLAGKGVHLSQQEGHMGVIGGPGETAKEKETRHIEQTILKLKKQLDKLSRARQTQRKQRISSGIPFICLIGYTNAGKSSLLNALTKSDVLAADKLFATLDTTTRELYMNGKKRGLLSDTVGFIQNLPHHLIEAFKSTLSELSYADLLLHVIDASNPNWRDHIKVVNTIMHELGVDKPVLYVFNKSDKLDSPKEYENEITAYTPHVLISAKSKAGLKPLLDYLEYSV
jgi:GTPase